METHRAEIIDWASAWGHEIIGFAEDPDVSASKTGPFERPALKHWLVDRVKEFDGVIVWKLDRIIRRFADLDELFAYLRRHMKMMFSVKEAWLRFDPRPDADPIMAAITDMMIRLVGLAAQMEAASIGTRVRAKQAMLRRFGYWPSGFAPYGYRLVEAQIPGAPTRGKVLEVEPDDIAHVHRMKEWTFQGKGADEIAAILMGEGVISPRQRSQIRQDKEPGPCVWWGKSVTNILTNRILIGEHHSNGEPIRNEDGTVMEYVAPVMGRADFALLQRVIEDRKSPHGKSTNPQNGLSGALECLGCGSPLYFKSDIKKSTGVIYRKYRCGGSKAAMLAGGCPAGRKTVPADRMHQIIEEAISGDLATFLLYQDVYVPGHGSYEDMEMAEEARDNLQADREAGLYRGDSGTAFFRARMAELEQRIEHLRSVGVTPSRWERQPTGDTLWDTWQSSPDWPTRRRLISMAGLTIRVMPGTGETHIFKDAAAEARMAEYASGGPLAPLPAPPFPHPATAYLAGEIK